MNNRRIAENIKATRKARGFTQETLAKKTGFSLATIQKYEEGARRPLLEGIEKIGMICEVNPMSLLDGAFDD